MSAERRYMVGTGYFAHADRGQDWFWHVWYENTVRFSQPVQVHVLGVGDQFPELTEGERFLTQWQKLAGNLGHTGAILTGSKPYRFCGCLAGMMQLALTSYCNETDFIYKEQDCLAFGPYVDAMYNQIGTRGAIVGRSRLMGIALSLILVRHAFIPDFVRLYLGTAPENTKDAMPEGKFARFLRDHPGQFCTYNFGVDRDRPLPIGSPDPWYAQKFTSDELKALLAAGLISAANVPVINHTTCSNG